MTQIESGPAAPLILPQGAKVTYEEFLANTPDDVHAEWEDGEVIYLTVDAENNRIQMFLSKLLGLYLELRPIGELFSEPFVMKTGPDLPGRSPDLFLLLTANSGRVSKHHIDGPADMVIEIVSPESASRDRGEKFYEYEKGGVGEYWLIDPLRKRAEFYQLDDKGLFVSVASGLDGKYESRILPGFRFAFGRLWQQPYPAAYGLLKEMGLL